MPFINPYIWRVPEAETVEKRYLETASLEAFAVAHEIAKRERNHIAPVVTEPRGDGEGPSALVPEGRSAQRHSSKNLLIEPDRSGLKSGRGSGKGLRRSSTKAFLDQLPLLDQLPGALNLDPSVLLDLSPFDTQSQWLRIPSFYRVPAVKFAMRLCVQIGVIVTYTVLILDVFQRDYGGEFVDGQLTDRRSISGTEIVWILFECSMLIDRLFSRWKVDSGNFSELSIKLSRSWVANVAYDVISDGATLTAFILRMVERGISSGTSRSTLCSLYQGYQVLISLKAGQQARLVLASNIASAHHFSSHGGSPVL